MTVKLLMQAKKIIYSQLKNSLLLILHPIYINIQWLPFTLTNLVIYIPKKLLDSILYQFEKKAIYPEKNVLKKGDQIVKPKVF